MKNIVTLSLGLASGLAASVAAAEGNVTIASWGGSYQEAQSKALFEPAAAATGIEVKQETYGGMSDVRLQVSSGQVTLDIVASAARARRHVPRQKVCWNRWTTT